MVGVVNLSQKIFGFGKFVVRASEIARDGNKVKTILFCEDRSYGKAEATVVGVLRAETVHVQVQ